MYITTKLIFHMENMTQSFSKLEFVARMLEARQFLLRFQTEESTQQAKSSHFPPIVSLRKSKAVLYPGLTAPSPRGSLPPENTTIFFSTCCFIT